MLLNIEISGKNMWLIGIIRTKNDTHNNSKDIPITRLYDDKFFHNSARAII